MRIYIYSFAIVLLCRPNMHHTKIIYVLIYNRSGIVLWLCGGIWKLCAEIQIASKTFAGAWGWGGKLDTKKANVRLGGNRRWRSAKERDEPVAGTHHGFPSHNTPHASSTFQTLTCVGPSHRRPILNAHVAQTFSISTTSSTTFCSLATGSTTAWPFILASSPPACKRSLSPYLPRILPMFLAVCNLWFTEKNNDWRKISVTWKFFHYNDWDIGFGV